MEFRIGCSGWRYSHWNKGVFYPTDVTLKNQFAYYASKFNTCEINNTFYKFPSRETVQKWYNDAPEGFKYTLKASAWITHKKKFNDVGDFVQNLYSLADILKEKLGCFLFQLPSNYHYKDENLQKIVKSLDAKYLNVVEFRHESWWNETVIQSFKEHNIIFSGTDGFGMPKEFYPAQDDTLYIRFHGSSSYSSNYSSTKLKHWAQTILQMKPKTVWIYFNNDNKGFAPHNALELIDIVKSMEPNAILHTPMPMIQTHVPKKRNSITVEKLEEMKYTKPKKGERKKGKE